MQPNLNEQSTLQAEPAPQVSAVETPLVDKYTMVGKVAWKLIQIPIFLVLGFFILTIISLGAAAIVIMSILSQYKFLKILVEIIVQLPLLGAILLLVVRSHYSKPSTRLWALISGVTVVALWALVDLQRLFF